MYKVLFDCYCQSTCFKFLPHSFKPYNGEQFLYVSTHVKKKYHTIFSPSFVSAILDTKYQYCRF